jgi:hypothetical protein
MPRGRRAKPAEVKALLGNPGKRRLALNNDADGKRTRAPAPPPLVLEPPFRLTTEERRLFMWATGSLPANLIRASDLATFARWATWMCVFVVCKNALEGKQHWYTTKTEHSPELHREHPLAKRMDKAEAHLVTLEDRLCLNIVARNNIMHRLFNMPGAHPGGGLFGVDPSEEDKQKPEAEVPPAQHEPDLDPLGFVERAGQSTH